MTELVARTGRQQQRYEAGCRLVAGCIPFKYRSFADNEDGKSEKVVEVLMINANSGPGLLFPKGGWENDETVEEAAAREALEEAGVRGDLLGIPTGDVLIFAHRRLSTLTQYLTWFGKPSTSTGEAIALYRERTRFTTIEEEELSPL